MSSTIISLIVLACVFGGALLGIFLHAVLPQHHLSSETKDIVKLGMGLVGTMAALVLGLLVASAKGSYDAQSAELTQCPQMSVCLTARWPMYGPETKEARAMLRGAVVRILDQMWSKDDTTASPAAPSAAGGEILYEKIQGLSPKNDTQRSLQGQALSIAVDIGKMRYLMYEQASHLGFHAVAGRAGSLAHRYFHQFRPLRPFQRDRRLQFVRLRAVGFRRDFLDLGDVHSIQWSDCSFQRPATCRPCASRTIGPNRCHFHPSLVTT